MNNPIPFDKYDQSGDYHWRECERRYSNYKAYNPALAARYQVVVDTVRRWAPVGRLLDVGCGDGFLMGQLAPLVKEAVGVDSEAAAIGIACQRLAHLPHCRSQHTVCYELPFAAGSFDVVTSTDVIEHLTAPAGHLREIGRVLKATGALVLTTPQWRPDRKWDTRHVQEFRPEELRQLLTGHFREVEMFYYWPMFWSRIYSTRMGWRLLKLLAIDIWNPFLGRSNTKPQKFGQMLAVCRQPAA